MELHGNLGDAEVESNLLVEPTMRHLTQNLPLTRSEGGKSFHMLFDDAR